LFLAIKARNTVILTVDSVAGEPSVGTPGSTAADTSSPVFLGGHRRERTKDGVTQEQYVGCIKDVFINDKPFKINASKAVGNVTVSACPAN